MTWQAFCYGLLCASSLGLGSVLALLWRPVDRVVAAITAFGAGVLLAALAFELVEEAAERAGFVPMALGAIGGGLLFAGLNKLLNARGAFLRKASTTKRVLRQEKRERAAGLLERLAKVEILRSLPPEEVQALVGEVEPHHGVAGTALFREGDVGDALYLIEDGEVDIVRGERTIATLRPGDAFGEMALLTGEPRSASAIARSDVRLLEVRKEAFDRLLRASPRLSLAVSQLLAKRLGATSARAAEAEAEQKRWQEIALRNIGSEALNPTVVEMRASASTHAGSAMAVWLGIVLDGSAESLVIGAGMRPDRPIAWALIAGVFCANFPEALSSAVGMRRSGFSSRRILALWLPTILLSGIFAALGSLFSGVAPSTLAAIEGLAAGAILTMVAETMMPEAYEQGGSVVGMTTLLGFLTAFFIKTVGH